MATFHKRVSKEGKTSITTRARLKGHRPLAKTFSRMTDARPRASSTESALKERRYFPTKESEQRTFAELLERFGPPSGLRYTRYYLPSSNRDAN